MEEVLDYLGSEIKVGDRGVRVHPYNDSAEFKKVTVIKINKERKNGASVGIITDGKRQIGWTYPERLIVQDSLKVII